MRILLIEDDPDLAALVSQALHQSGVQTDVCHDGSDGLYYARTQVYDAIVLDRMLPEIDGLTVLEAIRRHGLLTPVILATALDGLSDRICGLDAGADDYLVKPFEMGELLARIRSVMRRTLAQPSPFLLRFGDICFSEKESKLIHHDHTYLLPGREGQLLAYFLRNPQQVLNRIQIIGNVWGPEAEIEDGNLDNYIYLLRKKLNSLDTTVQIVTVHRQGYCLMAKQEE